MSVTFTARVFLGSPKQIQHKILANAQLFVNVDGTCVVQLNDWVVRANDDGSLNAFPPSRKNEATGKYYNYYWLSPNDKAAYAQAQQTILSAYAQAQAEGQSAGGQSPQPVPTQPSAQSVPAQAPAGPAAPPAAQFDPDYGNL